MGVGDSQTYKQHRDLISLLSFFQKGGFQGIGWEIMDRIQPTEDTDQWWDVLNVVINFQIP
jgi:hypothetical protein